MSLKVSPEDRAHIVEMENNFIELMRLFHRWPGIETYYSEHYLQGVSREPIHFIHSICRTRLTAANADERVAEAIGRCRERGVPMMWWQFPGDTPADLGAVLERQGMRSLDADPGMVLELDGYETVGAPPPQFHMRRILDATLLEPYVAILSDVFGVPPERRWVIQEIFLGAGLEAADPLEHYLGFWEESPVAIASVLFSGETAGIYNVATLPEARRKGNGAAICRGLLRRAQARGAQIACLQSSEAGYSIYERLGFRTVCRIPIYAWEPENE